MTALSISIYVLGARCERGIGDGHVEVFGHLVFVDEFADARADRGGAGQAAFGHGGDGRGECGLGGVEEVGAFAGPFGGQGGVAAGDESLAGVVGVADLGQVLLVERCRRPVRRSAGRAGRSTSPGLDRRVWTVHAAPRSGLR